MKPIDQQNIFVTGSIDRLGKQTAHTLRRLTAIGKNLEPSDRMKGESRERSSKWAEGHLLLE
ncbi:MAG: hypothetical protein NVS4B11_31280 [Ktedonobacteraceae bacterium]